MDDFSQKYPEIKYVLDISTTQEISDFFKPHLYRIIKELNENIGKHSGATIGKTTIVTNKQDLKIMVEDNGIGVNNNLDIKKQYGDTKGHLGLLSIKNDVNLLAGILKIHSRVGEDSGTIVEISIPVSGGQDESINNFYKFFI